MLLLLPIHHHTLLSDFSSFHVGFVCKQIVQSQQFSSAITRIRTESSHVAARGILRVSDQTLETNVGAIWRRGSSRNARQATLIQVKNKIDSKTQLACWFVHIFRRSLQILDLLVCAVAEFERRHFRVPARAHPDIATLVGFAIVEIGTEWLIRVTSDCRLRAVADTANRKQMKIETCIRHSRLNGTHGN
jgi:hypothetical protein